MIFSPFSFCRIYSILGAVPMRNLESSPPARPPRSRRVPLAPPATPSLRDGRHGGKAALPRGGVRGPGPDPALREAAEHGRACGRPRAGLHLPAKTEGSARERGRLAAPSRLPQGRGPSGLCLPPRSYARGGGQKGTPLRSPPAAAPRVSAGAAGRGGAEGRRGCGCSRPGRYRRCRGGRRLRPPASAGPVPRRPRCPEAARGRRLRRGRRPRQARAPPLLADSRSLRTCPADVDAQAGCPLS